MKEFTAAHDGLYVGREAEGPCKGALTLFTVGNPPWEAIKNACTYVTDNIISYGLDGMSAGLYIGGGSSIHTPLHISTLAKLLKHTENALFSRIAVQCTSLSALAEYTDFLLSHRKGVGEADFPLIEWIVPVIFDSYKMSESVLNQFRKADALSDCLLDFYGKVYIPNKVVLVTSLSTMYLAPDFDAKEGEYSTDVVLYKQDLNAHLHIPIEQHLRRSPQ